MRSTVASLLCLAFMGCGQKGPLKLPPAVTPAARPALNQQATSEPSFLSGVASDLNTAQAQQSRPL
jgi:predicted small lipoprotein YifL